MTEPATQPAVVATTTSLASSSSSQQQLTLTSSTNSMFMTMPIESISSLRSLDGLSQSSLDGAATTTQPPEQQVVQQQPNNKLTEKDNAAAFGLSLLRRQSSSGWKSLSATDKILEGDGPSSDRQLFGITSLSQLNSDYSGGFGAVSSTTDKRWGARLSRQSSLATQQTEDGASTASSCSDGCSPGIKVLQQPSPPTTSSSSEKKSSSSSSKKKPLSMEDMIRKQFHLELPPTPTTKTAAPSRASTTTKPAGSSTTTTSPPAALTTTTTTNPNKKSASRALFPSTSNSNNNNNNEHNRINNNHKCSNNRTTEAPMSSCRTMQERVAVVVGPLVTQKSEEST
uniref:Uncharacterized protein n=1 Tax=Grammatophora oceanica TaxID=210454 RepID=A0A7S1UMM5_9STRA